MDKVTYKVKKSRSFGLLVACILFAGLFFFFSFFDFKNILNSSKPNMFDNEIIYIIFRILFGLLFFLMIVLIPVIIKKFLLKQASLVLCYDYLIDESSAIGLGKIYYKDIKSVYIKDLFICIELKNPEEYLHKVSNMQRNLIMSNKKMGFEFICISDVNLDSDLRTIYNNIIEKIKVYRGEL